MLKGFPDLPPVWFAGAAAASWVLANYVPLIRFPEGFGRLFIVAGLGLICWAGIWFWRKNTPIEPGHPPRALIVEGPFRLNRNPIYTGLVLILVGFAAGQAAVSAFIPALLFPWIITRRFVLPEEAALRAAFGAEAEDWLATTRRW